jgi:hypothetical protein
MKPLDFLKNLPAPAQMLFRPMLMISLLLHGVLLMLPIPSEQEKPKLPRKEARVKITQLPTPVPSPKSSPQSSSKPNPQPSSQLSQSTRLYQPTRPEFSSELNPQPSFLPSQSTRLYQPTRPERMTTGQESAAFPLLLGESRSQSQQQSKSKKEEPQQQSTEQPTRSESTKEPTPSPSTEQSTPPPSAKEPTPSPPTEQPTRNNGATGDSYSEKFNQNQNQLFFEAVLEQVKRKYSEDDKLKQFKTEQDINKLTEADKFKDAKGNPDSRFKFTDKAVLSLTTQEIFSALEAKLSSLEFRINKIGIYGGAPLYEVTKADFKRYLILAPGTDEQGSITVIVVSENDPR